MIATAMLAAATMILLEFGKTSRVPRAMESCHRDGTVCGQHPHVNKPAILLSGSRWSSPLVAACVWEAVHSPDVVRGFTTPPTFLLATIFSCLIEPLSRRGLVLKRREEGKKAHSLSCGRYQSQILG